MASGTQSHTTVTKSSGMKFAQYDSIFVAQGYFIGDGTSEINLNLPIALYTYNNAIPCVVRRRDTGVISTYYITNEGKINGWDGSTARIFENDKEYWLTFVYIIQ